MSIELVYSSLRSRARGGRGRRCLSVRPGVTPWRQARCGESTCGEASATTHATSTERSSAERTRVLCVPGFPVCCLLDLRDQVVQFLWRHQHVGQAGFLKVFTSACFSRPAFMASSSPNSTYAILRALPGPLLGYDTRMIWYGHYERARTRRK